MTLGNVAQAARLADRNRSEFYKLLRKHNLDPQVFRSDEGVAAPGKTDRVERQ
jgi:two-component system response regulator GlrR